MPGREQPAVKIAGLITGVALAGTMGSCSSAPPSAEQVLRIGAIPDQNPEKLNRLWILSDEHFPQCGGAVRTRQQLRGAVGAFRSGSLDLVWLVDSPVFKPVCRHQGPWCWPSGHRCRFTSVFIANGASGLRPITVPINWCS